MKNILRTLTLSAAFLFAAVPNTATAQEFNIGFTDAEIIIAQMEEYRTIMTTLQGLAEGHQGEYQTLVQGYQEKANDYQKKLALLSETAKASREAELTEIQAQLQKFAYDKEQELATKEAEMMNPLLEKVQKAIDDVAAEKGLKMVLNVRSGGSPIILYADETMDVTPMVMDKLGIKNTTGAPSSR